MTLPDQRNERDLFLLRNDPQMLAIEYQETIRVIVSRYIRGGVFHFVDFDDIVQEVSLQFLLALPSTARHFNGSCLVRTYLSTTIRRICLQILRKSRLEVVDTGVADDYGPRVHSQDGSAHTRVFVSLEIAAFRAIIAQYDEDRGKLLLLLKLRYRLPLSRQDILTWYPNCTTDDQARLLSAFGAEYGKKPGKKVHAILLPVMQRAERRRYKVDNIRKWANFRAKEILSLLNGSPPISAHTEETLRLLVEDFFWPFLLP